MKAIEFSEIVRYPNDIPHHARDKLPKFDKSYEIFAKINLKFVKEDIKYFSVTH